MLRLRVVCGGEPRVRLASIQLGQEGEHLVITHIFGREHRPATELAGYISAKSPFGDYPDVWSRESA